MTLVPIFCYIYLLDKIPSRKLGKSVCSGLLRRELDLQRLNREIPGDLIWCWVQQKAL